jgi:NACHT domain
MWISGDPGVGKSAIASTLVSNLAKRGRLGSSFFFKRGDANLGNPVALWRTLAFDLARFHPCIKSSVVEFLSQPHFRDADIEQHFEYLIEDTLTKNCEQLSSAAPIIVIDALDECGMDEAYLPQRRILLNTLSRWSRLPQSFKLIVTSRDEWIPSSFLDPRFCRQITLETGDSVSDETNRDIRMFFEQMFADLRPTFGLMPSWPDEHVTDQLIKRAAGLFIWAKTAMEFIREKWGDPDAKLNLVLSGNLDEHSRILDALYQHILNSAFADIDSAAFALFRQVIGSVITAKAPFRKEDIDHFPVQRDENDSRMLSAILLHLSSVIELDPLIRLRHLSFAEFLCDSNRCSDARFYIDINEQHIALALACLRVMNSELRFNICGLDSSYVRNEDVADLPSRMDTSISSPLAYACRFWALHLCDTTASGNGCSSLLAEVRTFFDHGLLHWLEVMSLIREISASHTALIHAIGCIEVSGFSLHSGNFFYPAAIGH